jgi:hypothetical protein
MLVLHVQLMLITNSRVAYIPPQHQIKMCLEESAKTLLDDYVLALCRLQAYYNLRSKAPRHHWPRLVLVSVQILAAAGVLHIIPYSFESPIRPFQYSSIL